MSPRRMHVAQAAPRWVLALNLMLAAVYFAAIAFWFPHGNQWLFGVFVAGEVFHLWQTATYVMTVWRRPVRHRFDPYWQKPVDVFITVAGEPVEVVEQTVQAAKAMLYRGRVSVYILNDGRVAGKPNWRQMERLAERYGIGCITRTKPGGAKAGNINHALRQTRSPFVVIFDADHIPHPDFLQKTMGYFGEPGVGFVQSPQYYYNYERNYITGGAWEQQELFFGPIMQGKDRYGAAFMCGTNMVIRRTALNQVGGLSETNIAEDFMTSLFLHERGWQSIYVGEVLAEGLAPEDFQSYYKQQFRWARGSLEIVFRYNPLFRRGLKWVQKLQYLASASYYLNGSVVMMNALLPVIFLFTGQVVFEVTTMKLAAVFLPYMVLSVFVLQLTSDSSYTFRALGMSSGSGTLQIKALWAVLTGQKTSFAVTSKSQVAGNFIHLAWPQLAYFPLVVAGVAVAVAREGWTASVATNISWAFLTGMLFAPFIYAATPLGARIRTAEPVAQHGVTHG
jgi:cellulose synthase (UDP-forming)